MISGNGATFLLLRRSASSGAGVGPGCFKVFAWATFVVGFFGGFGLLIVWLVFK